MTTSAESVRGIVKISGDLYRYQENAHFSVFLVTPEGVIATDPLNKETAEWLKVELKKRFNQSVKYLVYSHHHDDHISGGEVFKDTALIIAHANAVAGIKLRQVPTALPDLTFTDKMTLTLGGSVVELSYAGLSHSDDSVVVHFPAQRAVYAVDFVLAKALPYQDLPLWAYHYPAWLESLQKLEQMDFDILLPGHDQIGTHADVRLFRHYLEDLETAVRQSIAAGQSVVQMQETIELEEYRDWAKFNEWFKPNIKGMHRQISQ